MLKQIIGIVFVLALCNTTHAQTTNVQTDTVRWNAIGFDDLIANVYAEGACQFISYGSGAVDWLQSNGNFITNFTGTGSSGTWTDASVNGSITISIVSGALTGQVVLYRTSDGLRADLTLTGGTVDIKNSYHIQSIEKL